MKPSNIIDYIHIFAIFLVFEGLNTVFEAEFKSGFSTCQAISISIAIDNIGSKDFATNTTANFSDSCFVNNSSSFLCYSSGSCVRPPKAFRPIQLSFKVALRQLLSVLVAFYSSQLVTFLANVHRHSLLKQNIDFKTRSFISENENFVLGVQFLYKS